MNIARPGTPAIAHPSGLLTTWTPIEFLYPLHTGALRAHDSRALTAPGASQVVGESLGEAPYTWRAPAARDADALAFQLSAAPTPCGIAGDRGPSASVSFGPQANSLRPGAPTGGHRHRQARNVPHADRHSFKRPTPPIRQNPGARVQRQVCCPLGLRPLERDRCGRSQRSGRTVIRLLLTASAQRRLPLLLPFIRTRRGSDHACPDHPSSPPDSTSLMKFSTANNQD